MYLVIVTRPDGSTRYVFNRSVYVKPLGVTHQAPAIVALVGYLKRHPLWKGAVFKAEVRNGELVPVHSVYQSLNFNQRPRVGEVSK